MKYNNSHKPFTETKISLRESKHQRGHVVKEHYHKNHQLLYVLENNGKLILDNKEHNLSEDCLVFIAPYSNHAITAHDKLVIQLIEFNLEAVDFNKLTAINRFFAKSLIVKLNPFQASEIRHILRKMLYEQTIDDELNQLPLEVYLAQLLIVLLRVRKDRRFYNADFLRAERLKEYIDSHYFEMLNASSLASLLGLSTKHINTIFKEAYQITPVQYLIKVRIELAKKLLIETDKDIISICFEVGFEAMSTFYRSFKDYSLLSPHQYRKKYQAMKQLPESSRKDEIDLKIKDDTDV